MKKNKSELFFPATTSNPHALANSYNSDLAQQETYERLSHMSKEQIVKEMPDVYVVETSNGDRIQHIVLYGTGEDNSDNANVMLLPWGNGWAPHMYVRALQAQAALGDNTKLIIFPNATPGNSPYILTKEEQASVASGRLDVVAEKQLRAVEALGVISVESLIGFSQGAGIGGAVLRLAGDNGSVQIGNAHLGEAANGMDREEKRLKSDFTKGGFGPFTESVNGSGIPALSGMLNTRGGLDNVRLFGSLPELIKGSKIPENKALYGGMSHDTFMGDLISALRASPDLKIILLNAEDSLIYPKAVASAIGGELNSMFPGRVLLTTVKGEGHAFADNTTAYAASLHYGQGLMNAKKTA